LQNDLNKLIKWEGKWKMAFNVDKCKVMHITRARTTKKHPLLTAIALVCCGAFLMFLLSMPWA
jgi:hypothetical protein